MSIHPYGRCHSTPFYNRWLSSGTDRTTCCACGQLRRRYHDDRITLRTDRPPTRRGTRRDQMPRRRPRCARQRRGHGSGARPGTTRDTRPQTPRGARRAPRGREARRLSRAARDRMRRGAIDHELVSRMALSATSAGRRRADSPARSKGSRRGSARPRARAADRPSPRRRPSRPASRRPERRPRRSSWPVQHKRGAEGTTSCRRKMTLHMARYTRSSASPSSKSVFSAWCKA